MIFRKQIFSEPVENLRNYIIHLFLGDMEKSILKKKSLKASGQSETIRFFNCSLRKKNEFSNN